jgi:hypothetical protein
MKTLRSTLRRAGRFAATHGWAFRRLGIGLVKLMGPPVGVALVLVFGAVVIALAAVLLTALAFAAVIAWQIAVDAPAWSRWLVWLVVTLGLAWKLGKRGDETPNDVSTTKKP